MVKSLRYCVPRPKWCWMVLSMVLFLFVNFWSQQAQSSDGTVEPGENLIADGLPRISRAFVENTARYKDFRSASVQSWHPLKREMLITTRLGAVSQIHILRMPGGARTQLTFSPDASDNAKYEPRQGRYFIFSKDIGGNERDQFYRYDLASGDITLLTDGKSRNVRAVWNHTGDGIAYNSTRRNGKDLDVYLMDPLDPKSDKMLLRLEGDSEVFDWSQDGKYILLQEYLSADESYLWKVGSDTGAKSLITPKGGITKASYSDARFSRDGHGVFVTTDKESEFKRLAYLDIATGRLNFLTEQIPWDVEAFAITDDGRRIAFITNEDGISRLHLLDTATNRERPVPNLPVGVISRLMWHKNGRDLGFVMSSAHAASDAYSVDTSTGVNTRWTYSETGGLNTAAFAEPELIKWKSFDGKLISGFLYKPPAKFLGKRPVIVNFHGGPESQFRPALLIRSNYYLNELGVAVIYPNIRGSSGYGKSFLQADNGLKRADAYRDVGALLDWIKSNKDLDGDRILITGGSHGAHIALIAATMYNEKICCTIVTAGISNFVSFLEHTEDYRRDLRRAEYGDERDQAIKEFMERTAPFNNAEKITKPLFVIAGRNDPRVPISEAEQMVARARKSSTNVWFLVGKNEGHGFQQQSNLDFQFYSTILFMQTFLLK